MFYRRVWDLVFLLRRRERHVQQGTFPLGGPVRLPGFRWVQFRF